MFKPYAITLKVKNIISDKLYLRLFVQKFLP